MATCHLCPDGDNQLPDAGMLDHLRVLHPDAYGDGPQRWPDGSLVVLDCTLEPWDFEAAGDSPEEVDRG